MAREIVPPHAHAWLFTEVVRIAHKGILHSSETLRYRYVCQRCCITQLLSDAPHTQKAAA